MLLDSLNKRVKFLNEVIGQLGLSKITAIHGRAEDFARQKEYREQFDLVVSRAVANLSSLSEYCLPYVKVGGRFVSYKSGKLNEELVAAQKSDSCAWRRGKRAGLFPAYGNGGREIVCLYREGEGNAEEVSEKSGNTGEGADSVKNNIF